VLGFHVPALPVRPWRRAWRPEINAWVVVQPDDTVVIRIARSEMGQGTLTGLAQLVAEELECDWAKVTTEYPTPGQNLARNRVWGNFSTGGSRGIRESHDYVRKGGATARMMLVQAAADEWKVPAAECRAANSVITHGASGRSTTYGKVAAAAAKLTPPADVPLKDPKDWKLAGKRLARLDTVDKTTGKQIYGADLKLPGMLNAAIKDCPVFGGKVKSFDAAAVRNARREEGGARGRQRRGRGGRHLVARQDRAGRAAHRMGPGPARQGPASRICRHLKAGAGRPGSRRRQQQRRRQGGAGRRGAQGRGGLQLPAPEPRDHGADERHRALDAPSAARSGRPRRTAKPRWPRRPKPPACPPRKCEVYKLHLGGGFGRRGAVHDWVRQAVEIAKEMPGTPVKLLWSREEDMLHGRYHPVTQCKLTAGLDAQGNLTGAAHAHLGPVDPGRHVPAEHPQRADPVVFQGLNNGGGEAMIGYSFPNLLVDHAMRNPHVPPGFWRGVNLNQNAIYLECFIDEVAARHRQDPLALRRKLMEKHPKHLAVLNAVAERRLGHGRARRERQKVFPRPGADAWLRQLCGGLRRGVGQRRRRTHGAPHRGRHRPRPCRQPAADRGAGRRLVRLRPVGRAVRRMHGQGRRIEQTTSTPTR
jgi:isoquinoline 1-oxidoreductase beta subunit